MTNKVLFVSNYKKEKLVYRMVLLAVVVLFIIVAVVPGCLQMLYRADAQVALGNAKTVRMALQSVATDTYSKGETFCDISGHGGVTEEVWQRVILLSKAPGEFFILQMDEKEYEVTRFLYREGDYTVYYCKEPLSYEVYREEGLIQTQWKMEETAE